MRSDLVTHDPDALFIIAKQQRDQAVTEANDAERRQTAKRRDSRSMAAAGTKPQGRAVDEHDSRENAKAAGVKAERSRRYNNECFVCGKQDTSSGTVPKASRVRRGKASMTRPTARPPHSSSSPQTVPLNMPGARQLGWPLHLPPLELVGTRPPQKRWIRRLNLLRLKRLHRMTKTTCTFACRGRRWRRWLTGSPRRCSTRFPIALGRRMKHQLFTPFRCSRRQPHHSSGVEVPAPYIPRVPRSSCLADVVRRS